MIKRSEVFRMSSPAVLEEAIDLPLTSNAITLLAPHADVELSESGVVVGNALVVVRVDGDVAVDLLS